MGGAVVGVSMGDHRVGLGFFVGTPGGASGPAALVEVEAKFTR